MRRQLYLFFLSLPLLGCTGGERFNTGKCPAGELCSDETPTGLQFIGAGFAGVAYFGGPATTAIGGTQEIALQYDRGDGVDVALDVPFTADDEGGLGVRVDAIRGSQVIVRGAGSRSNYLRILDTAGRLMDRKTLTGAAVDRIELTTADYEQVPANRQLAYAAGKRQLGIALYGDVQTSDGARSYRLVDTSMALTLAGSTRKSWDILELDATAGTSTLSVTAGDKPAATFDIVVVDHADNVAMIPGGDVAVSPNQPAWMCFEAVAAGRYVAGLTWTYVIDDAAPIVQADGTLFSNCVTVSTQKTTGTVNLQVSAGGQSTAMALPVSVMARESKPSSPALGKPTVHATTTAGDRASM